MRPPDLEPTSPLWSRRLVRRKMAACRECATFRRRPGLGGGPAGAQAMAPGYLRRRHHGAVRVLREGADLRRDHRRPLSDSRLRGRPVRQGQHPAGVLALQLHGTQPLRGWLVMSGIHGPERNARRPGRRGGDARGSAADRLARRLWLLRTFGDGQRAPCAYCKAALTIETITVDRYPIPGCQGGRYTRDNIRPACKLCNSEHGGRLRRAA